MKFLRNVSSDGIGEGWAGSDRNAQGKTRLAIATFSSSAGSPATKSPKSGGGACTPRKLCLNPLNNLVPHCS